MRRYLALVVLVAGCATAQSPRTPAQEWVYTNVKACEDQVRGKVWLSHVEPDGLFTLGFTDGGVWTVSSSEPVGAAAALGVDVTTPDGRRAVNAALPAGLALGGDTSPPHPDVIAAQRVVQCVLRRQFDECERATGYKITPRALSRPEPATRPFSDCLRARFGTR